MLWEATISFQKMYILGMVPSMHKNTSPTVLGVWLRITYSRIPDFCESIQSTNSKMQPFFAKLSGNLRENLGQNSAWI